MNIFPFNLKRKKYTFLCLAVVDGITGGRLGKELQTRNVINLKTLENSANCNVKHSAGQN